MGRSRIHRTDADRQRAYRDRRRGAPTKRLTQAELADYAGTSVRSIQRAARLCRLHAMAPRHFPEIEPELRHLCDQVETGQIGLHPALDLAEAWIAARAMIHGPVDQ